MLKNQEILKKLIIEKIPNVKKINLEFFSVFPDVYFIKEPKNLAFFDNFWLFFEKTSKNKSEVIFVRKSPLFS